MKGVLAVAGKDLRSDWRAMEVAPSMILFGLVLIFLFTFALPPGAGRAPIPAPQAGAVASREVAATFLWAAILFSGIVSFGRTAAIERDGGRMEALLLSPLDPAALFFGKTLANFVFLSALELILVPAFILFFDVPAGLVIPKILPLALLANSGLAGTGTLMAHAAGGARAKELVLPVLAFPLLLPVVLGASSVTSALLGGDSLASQIRWFVLLGSYDIAIAAVGSVTFDYLIRE